MTEVTGFGLPFGIAGMSFARGLILSVATRYTDFYVPQSGKRTRPAKLFPDEDDEPSFATCYLEGRLCVDGFSEEVGRV